MPKETIATSDVYDGGVPQTNILKVAWGAKGAAPDAPDGWVNAGYAHLYIGTKEQPFLGTVELGEDEIDHLIRVLKRVRRQAFRRERSVRMDNESRYRRRSKGDRCSPSSGHSSGCSCP